MILTAKKFLGYHGYNGNIAKTLVYASSANVLQVIYLYVLQIIPYWPVLIFEKIKFDFPIFNQR